MPRKTLYILSGAAVLFFALGLLIMPETFWGMYGGTIGPLGVWVGRMMTAVMFANVYMFWNLRDAPLESKGAKTFSQGQVIAWGLTAVYVAIGTIVLGLNLMSWSTVALGVAFVVLFAIDGFKK
jgi:hypothetical protein